LQKLLIFDVWRDFLVSKEGKHLMSVLFASDQMQERRLGEQIETCCALLPKDVDSWMRMFISCVQDVEPMGVCICDMSIAYAPIIHVNKGWRSMTGYTSEDAVGRSCRFLQGPSTSEESVASIREAIRTGTRAVVRVVNYRKDGSLFNNMLTLRPIFDDAGHMVFMVAISVAVSNSFKRMKPLLTQLNRLNHLLPERLNLPAVASVRRRLSLGHGAMLKRRAAMLRKQQDAPPVGGEKERSDAWIKQRHQLTVVTDVAVKKAQERVAERQREKMQQGSPAASPASSTSFPGTASKRVSTSKAASSFTEGQTPKPNGSRKSVLDAMDMTTKIERLASAHPASSAYHPRGNDLRMSATKRPATAGKTPTHKTLPMLMPGSKDTPTIHRASLPASSPASSPQPPKGSLSARGPAPGRQRFISEHIPTPPKSARVTRQP
jgi:PAS domain S-box-containing protein